MRSFSAVLPAPSDFLALSPRQLAGLLLELMNAVAYVRSHPKTLANDVLAAYPSASQERLVQHLMAALDLLAAEGYTFRDMKDAVDNDWFALTEKGRAVRDRAELNLPERVLDSARPLIFISCGQFSEHERSLGKRLAELIEGFTPYAPFFAQNENSFEALSRNIITALHRMSGMVFVMHKRGRVETPHGSHDRGSVWIEQEIAIAASLRQLRNSELAVAGYIEDGIRREGLRDLLHLNTVPFTNDSQVIEHFEQQLRSGQFLVHPQPHEPSGPVPLLRLAARMVGPDEGRRIGLVESNATRLLVEITNAGGAPAEDVVLSYEGLSTAVPEDRIGPLGPGEIIRWATYLPTYRFDSAAKGSVPERILATYKGAGVDGGRSSLQRDAGSHPPTYRFEAAVPPGAPPARAGV